MFQVTWQPLRPSKVCWVEGGGHVLQGHQYFWQFLWKQVKVPHLSLKADGHQPFPSCVHLDLKVTIATSHEPHQRRREGSLSAPGRGEGGVLQVACQNIPEFRLFSSDCFIGKSPYIHHGPPHRGDRKRGHLKRPRRETPDSSKSPGVQPTHLPGSAPGSRGGLGSDLGSVHIWPKCNWELRHVKMDHWTVSSICVETYWDTWTIKNKPKNPELRSGWNSNRYSPKDIQMSSKYVKRGRQHYSTGKCKSKPNHSDTPLQAHQSRTDGFWQLPGKVGTLEFSHTAGGHIKEAAVINSYLLKWKFKKTGNENYKWVRVLKRNKIKDFTFQCIGFLFGRRKWGIILKNRYLFSLYTKYMQTALDCFFIIL